MHVTIAKGPSEALTPRVYKAGMVLGKSKIDPALDLDKFVWRNQLRLSQRMVHVFVTAVPFVFFFSLDTYHFIVGAAQEDLTMFKVVQMTFIDLL